MYGKDSPEPRGVTKPLSPARRIIAETMYHGAKVPLIACSRDCSLTNIVAARRRASPVPSWMAIFLKAAGHVAREYAELRRCVVTWPWTRVYEHPLSNAMLPVEREHEGERVVFMAKLMRPEELTLAEIDSEVRRFQTAPLQEVSYFRQALMLGRLPWWMLRFVFWQTLSLSGFKRAKRFGTFSITSVGSEGAEIETAISPLGTYLSFGPISPSGSCRLRIQFDHRLYDARQAARILQCLEHHLNETVAMEINSDGERQAA